MKKTQRIKDNNLIDSYKGKGYVSMNLGGLDYQKKYKLLNSGSASASHQCGPGSIPGWGSDPGAVSEKALSSLVLGTLSRWPSLPTSTNPIRETLKNPQHFLKGRGISLVLEACPISDALITRIPEDEESLCGNYYYYYYLIFLIFTVLKG